MTTTPSDKELPLPDYDIGEARNCVPWRNPQRIEGGRMTTADLAAILSALDPETRARVLEPYLPKAPARFPVLHGGKFACPRSVPWGFVEPQELQAVSNHGQSLKRLAERGGLSPAELVAVLLGERWSCRTFDTDEEAAVELKSLLAAYENSELTTARAEVERLRAACVAADDLLAQYAAQWGDDYLAQKWGLSEERAQFRVAAGLQEPEPKEPT